MMQSLDLTIHLALAFDIGYEINLDQVRELLAGESGNLPRRKRTPESIRYRPAPVRVGLEVGELSLPGKVAKVGPPRGELAFFDFGAVSLMVRFPVRTNDEELREALGELADPATWTASARRLLAPWFEKVRPAVTEFEVSELSEEYVIFQLDEVEPGWHEENLELVASLVRLEAGPLSVGEIREANRLCLSYSPTDLVVMDWAAGVVADSEYADTIQVIEFANVQLLEYRHIDDRLDDRLEAAYSVIHPERRRHWPSWLWRTHTGALRQVRELEIEATSLFERADNALKLIGDQYLARIHGLASSRFHLDGWQRSIRRKLETVGDVYDLLVQQASGTRIEFLEILIVLLIALEIVLALVQS